MKFRPGLDRHRASTLLFYPSLAANRDISRKKSLGSARRTKGSLTLPAEFGLEDVSYRAAPLPPLDPRPPSLPPDCLDPVAGCVQRRVLVVLGRAVADPGAELLARQVDQAVEIALPKVLRRGVDL
jgi:hypothetical protein